MRPIITLLAPPRPARFIARPALVIHLGRRLRRGEPPPLPLGGQLKLCFPQVCLAHPVGLLPSDVDIRLDMPLW